MQPGSIEQSVGITTYLTPYPGIHGTLRTIPEDFFVQELPLIPKPDENGKHTIAWVQSTNWDTHLLVKKISNRLEISSKRISFAGTKDKRAVTSQLMSFFNITKEQLTNLTIKDVTITPLHTTKKPIDLGQLQGNQFKIILRAIDQNITNNHISEYTEYFTKNPGFPNYFGIQRFGGIRPITHLVGKHIILNGKEPVKEGTLIQLRFDLKGSSKHRFNDYNMPRQDKSFIGIGQVRNILESCPERYKMLINLLDLRST